MSLMWNKIINCVLAMMVLLKQPCSFVFKSNLHFYSQNTQESALILLMQPMYVIESLFPCMYTFEDCSPPDSSKRILHSGTSARREARVAPALPPPTVQEEKRISFRGMKKATGSYKRCRINCISLGNQHIFFPSQT